MVHVFDLNSYFITNVSQHDNVWKMFILDDLTTRLCTCLNCHPSPLRTRLKMIRSIWKHTKMCILDLLTTSWCTCWYFHTSPLWTRTQDHPSACYCCNLNVATYWSSKLGDSLLLSGSPVRFSLLRFACCYQRVAQIRWQSTVFRINCPLVILTTIW